MMLQMNKEIFLNLVNEVSGSTLLLPIMAAILPFFSASNYNKLEVGGCLKPIRLFKQREFQS